MKKLPIVIMLAAAGITGVAFAQTSPGTYNSGTTGYGTSGSYSTDGASGTTGYGTGTTSGAYGTGTTSRAPKSPTGGVNGGDAATSIGQDLGSYGKTSGASGSQTSPQYGKKSKSKSTGMDGAAGTTGTYGTSSGMSGASSGGITWTCPPGYTLSTATRDGSPLCYPSSGPMPGGTGMR